jgi:hypothetical protein
LAALLAGPLADDRLRRRAVEDSGTFIEPHLANAVLFDVGQ